MIKVATAMIALVLFSGNAFARDRFESGGSLTPDNRYPHTMDVRGFGKEKANKSRQPFQSHHSHRRISAKSVHLRQTKAHRYARMARTAAAVSRGSAETRQPHQQASRSLHGVIGPLAEKAEQIVRECGSWIMSAVRHTQVAGSGRLSCHANGHAVDISGNPSCIYRNLQGWRGGYSTDYAQVRCRGVACPHVHVSLGCSEDGKRFVHYGTRVRNARRHHRMAGG